MSIGLMDALEIERAHVVGHSTGGAIAQILAIEHPKRLASVVLSASWTKPDAYFRRLFRLRKDILLRLGPSAYVQANTLFLYPSWWVARNNERLRQLEAQNLAVFPPTEIAASRIDAILAFDRTEQLGRIKTPTLVVGAEDDIITPAYFSEELARLIPGRRSRSFRAAGSASPRCGRGSSTRPCCRSSPRTRRIAERSSGPRRSRGAGRVNIREMRHLRVLQRIRLKVGARSCRGGGAPASRSR